MATEDYFLMLDGIKGESADDKHKGEIQIESFSFGVSNAGSGGSATGSGTGRANIQDMHFTKRIDKSSPLLQLACATGKHISKGKITVRKAGETPLDYLVYDLENVFVSSVTHSGTQGGGIPQESISLNFAKIKTEYWTQNDKGAKGENTNFAWDVAANKKL